MRSNKSDKNDQLGAYAKYSGMAIQMALTIGFFSWIGLVYAFK